MKPVLATCLAVGLLLPAAQPAAAQDPETIRALVDVCLPYASRALSLERSVARARELEFRRPVGDQAPLDEWASEVEMVSRDGSWRLHIEEGSTDVDDRPAYAAACTVSSPRASVRRLMSLGRRAFGDVRRWTPTGDGRSWERLTRYPDEYRLRAVVVEEAGQLPALVIEGIYF